MVRMNLPSYLPWLLRRVKDKGKVWMLCERSLKTLAGGLIASLLFTMLVIWMRDVQVHLLFGLMAEGFTLFDFDISKEKKLQEPVAAVKAAQ